jgi:aldehyde:ferredoxin oxidoreductase
LPTWSFRNEKIKKNKMNTDKLLYNVLHIDLTTKRFWVKKRNDLFDKYIGGTGVATKLLMEECPQGADALGSDNPIILAVGPLTGVYPLASKTVAMFKSPLTGNLGESHVGGRSAIAIRMAGYGAIVINGKSDIPVYISIHGKKVKFKEATTIWGMKSSITAGRIMRENETGHGVRSILRIGRAGEKMVKYAAVTAETYRHFGRLGLGAVFGSKLLKGIVIAGENTVKLADPKGFKKLYNRLYEAAVDTSLMKKYHDLGTPVNVMVLDKIGALPVKNLTERNLKGIEKISGEYLAANYLARRIACAHCPVGCIHLAAIKEVSEHEDYFHKTTLIGYDFELIYSLGSMLGITEPEPMLKLIEEVEVECVDAMSVGVVMAWATEMFEKKLISENETLGLKPVWGEASTYMEMLSKIVLQENDFYKALASGVDYASSIYGGKEFALSFGKNEMPGYHTGPATYLGFLLGARHSHLDNAGYSIDQSELLTKDLKPEDVVEKIIKEESLRQILSSIMICFFARGIYTIDVVAEALKTIGFEFSDEDLLKIGREILADKYRFKAANGHSIRDLRIPERIYEAPDPTGKITPEFIEKGLKYASIQLENK